LASKDPVEPVNALLIEVLYIAVWISNLKLTPKSRVRKMLTGLREEEENLSRSQKFEKRLLQKSAGFELW